ncbi:MAG TPA: DUF3108 domain-containing protein [Longimicrobiales bacterium]|nr:DUF3108 domain-containing protein [Longimicrobiales bacterium]
MSRRVLSAALAVAGGLVAVTPSGAQTSDSAQVRTEWPADARAARVSFGPGERLVYKVKVGVFNAGEARISIVDLDTVRGNPTYRASMTIDGGLGPAHVDDEYTSWFDIRNLRSWRYVRDIHELSYKSYRHYEFYPSRRMWEREDNDESGPLGSSLPLDDVAFIYYIRTLPLEVGKTYTMNRYFKEDGNPVVVRVLRKDERETEAGTFRTIVVKPIIKTDGLFGEGGDAELHFTDDDRRILVYLKSNIPKFPGSLTLHLQEIREGLPLHPASRAAAVARIASGGERGSGSPP